MTALVVKMEEAVEGSDEGVLLLTRSVEDAGQAPR